MATREEETTSPVRGVNGHPGACARALAPVLARQGFFEPPKERPPPARLVRAERERSRKRYLRAFLAFALALGFALAFFATFFAGFFATFFFAALAFAILILLMRCDGY